MNISKPIDETRGRVFYPEQMSVSSIDLPMVARNTDYDPDWQLASIGKTYRWQLTSSI